MTLYFSTTVVGHDRPTIVARAQSAILAFYGTLEGISVDVSVTARLLMDGRLLHYEGRVTAYQNIPAE